MGDIDTVGTLGSMGIVGSSAARGAATVGTLQAVLTGVVLLLLVASVLAYVWRAPMARGWRARLRRSGGGWRRSGRWRRVGCRVGRQMGGAIARHVGRVPPLRSALDAEALLRRLLSPAEYRGLRRKRYLEVASRGHAGRMYRVPHGGGLVEVVEGGRVVERLCVGPVERLPRAEVVLVHKLLIEADEEGYLAAANHLTGDTAWPAVGGRAAAGLWLGREH